MAGGSIPPGWGPIFQAAGHQYGIPPAVLVGISSVESNLGRNNGPSSAGAIGPMQFEPGTARGLGINPNDPKQAIFGAAKLLVQYGYHQNPTRAIGAYNGGPGNPQYGYARQVLSEASRLGGQLGGGGTPSPASPGGGGGGSLSVTVPQTVQSFDQAGFNAAKARYIAGTALKEAASSANPYNTVPGTSKGLNASIGSPSGALFARGLLTTTAPNPGDFTSTQTVNHVYQLAQNNLQKLAGTQLRVHPGASGIAGGFLPAGARYVPGRKDQGRDGQTNPGGPIIANGNGVVVNVLSDPNGFGPRYPVVRFTSGPYAGQTIYFGHTLATVQPGQQVRPGQVLSRTGTSGVGNATVPGWFEIGFAPGGSPGRFGQATPF